MIGHHHPANRAASTSGAAAFVFGATRDGRSRTVLQGTLPGTSLVLEDAILSANECIDDGKLGNQQTSEIVVFFMQYGF